MLNQMTEFVPDPVTFESVCRLRGYWIVSDSGGAIGILHGTVIATAPPPFEQSEWGNGIWISGNQLITLITDEGINYIKPAPLAQFETAKAFGFGTQYDPKHLPDLVKLPDEIPLDNSRPV